MSTPKEKEVIATPGERRLTIAYFFEQVRRSKMETGFLVYNLKTDRLRYERRLVNSNDPEVDLVYIPRSPPLFPLATFTKEQEGKLPIIDEKMVFDKIKKFVIDFVELPYDALYDVVTLWIMSSYALEKFDTVSYLSFIGPKDSGKTRALETIRHLAYRGLVSPSFTPAGLFRMIDAYSPTLCLDEAEIYGNEIKTEAIAVLNAGYRRGQYVIRCWGDSHKIKAFRCFGHKALASTDIFVPTVESRSIIINMRKNSRDFPLFIDKKRAAQLRFMLLVYQINIMKENMKLLLNEEEVVSYLPIKNGRLAELFFPLIAVAPSEEIRKKVGEFVKEVERERIEEERATSEAELVELLYGLKGEVEKGKLSIKVITEKYNEGKPERQHWGPKSVGRALKKLGFTQTRISGGSRAIIYNEKHLDYLVKRYIPREMSQTSLMSSSNQSSDKSDVSDKSDLPKRLTSSLDDLVLVSCSDEPVTEKECGVCGLKKQTNWVAATNNRKVISICEDCVEEFKKRRAEL